MTRVLGVITARGGSKGVPGKNIKSFGGHPLIYYSIIAAQGAKTLARTLVSTDDEAIANIARNLGADVPFLRPPELAADTTLHLPVLQHAVAFAESQDGVQYDIIVTLQPTSPLRIAADIDAVVSSLISSEADSAVSVVEYTTHHPAKAKIIEGGFLRPFCGTEPEGIRRQSLPRVYERNGSVYAVRRDVLLGGHIYGDRILPYVMSEDRSLDIDTQEDFDRGERMLATLRTEGHPI